MDQSMIESENHRALNKSADKHKIAFIQAGWHSDIVNQAHIAFIEQWQRMGLSAANIDDFDVPGSLEIPLQAQRLANSGTYAVIVAAGLIVDGGIYRHDFVAATVLDAMMEVQLKTEVPILSVVLTPHQFQESEAHRVFFQEHFQLKGREAAEACQQTLSNLERLNTVA